ncbi:glycosyltransferase [Kaistia algarum]|uniref:glycosyltransferase n=1 Tax=Kaistia algarum TaxID=2083279 RepID=UPI00224E9B9C|nr:glycosyltransferase [Kaistia algarum]MCX5512702.1 glycosyltransferase [Kaistia algarum]
MESLCVVDELVARDDAVINGGIGITVVLVTYNHENYIDQALAGIFSQELDVEFDVVISDDLSTDGTRTVIQKYIDRYPGRIELIVSDKNLNDQEVSTRAIKAAKGKYIAFLDGDDYWISSEKLRRQFDFMEANPDCAICYHDVARVTDDGEIVRVMAGTPGRASIDDIIMGNFIPSCSSFIRRSTIAHTPDWIRELDAGDWAYHVVAAESGWIGHVEGVLAHYRIHDGAAWSTLPLIEQWVRTLSMLTRMERHLGERHRDAFFHSRINLVSHIVASLDRDRHLSSSEVQRFEADQARLQEESARAAHMQFEVSEANQRLKTALDLLREMTLEGSRRVDRAVDVARLVTEHANRLTSEVQARELAADERERAAREALRDVEIRRLKEAEAAEERVSHLLQQMSVMGEQVHRLEADRYSLATQHSQLAGQLGAAMADAAGMQRSVRRIRRRERAVVAAAMFFALMLLIEAVLRSGLFT